MKKYGLIIVLVLLLTILLVYNLNLSNKLSASIVKAETLEIGLQKTNMDKGKLELEVSDLTDELSQIKNKLQDKTKTLTLIDDKLEGDGEILKRIDDIINEHDKLRNELNAIYFELNVLKEANSIKADGVVYSEIELAQFDKDIEEILEVLDARISVLRDGISNLSTFSIERIMVNQEIDFLESTYSMIRQLKEDFLME